MNVNDNKLRDYRPTKYEWKWKIAKVDSWQSMMLASIRLESSLNVYIGNGKWKLTTELVTLDENMQT